MIVNIQVMFGYSIEQLDAKPFYTKEMPLINPHLISMTNRNKQFINKVFYRVIDKNTASVWGEGDTQADAINDCKRQYKEYENEGVLVDELNACMRTFEEALKWEKIERAESSNVVEIKSQPKKLETKLPKRAIVFKKNDGKCFYCDDQLEIDAEWHIEHKHPKSKGGTNDIDNLVPSCRPCNLKKHNKTAKEFLEASA